MLLTKKCSEVSVELYNNRKIQFRSLGKEIIEIFEELFQGKFKASWIEVLQVLFLIQMIFHQRTGIDFELRFVDYVIKDFYERVEVWKEIFKENKLEFHIDYLRWGSNYNRPYKVERALKEARKEQEK